MADEPELSIMIPLKAIYESFLCPICLNEVTDCHITSCGHNFCEACIRECLNRKHACPCCNAETTQDKLVKNHHFDSLFQIVQEQKENASKKYVDVLMKTAKVSQQGIKESKDSSPIEELFQKHIRRSLLDYEEYYKDLQQNFNRNKLKLKADYSVRMEELQAKRNVELKFSGLLEEENKDKGDNLSLVPPISSITRSSSTDQLVKTAEKVAEEYKEELKKLESQFNKSVRLLTESFDSYMGRIAPSAFLVPVKCTLSIAERGIRCEASLKSAEPIGEVRQILIDRTAGNGDPIVEYGKDIVIYIKRPFGSKGAGGKNDNKDSKIENQVEEKINDETITVGELKLEQGTEIILKGTVKLKSEDSQKCFAMIYDKDAPNQRMDYFKCDTCQCNWICKPCAMACHKGHKVISFMMNHRPSYGCCYCKKKKMCSLDKKKV